MPRPPRRDGLGGPRPGGSVRVAHCGVAFIEWDIDHAHVTVHRWFHGGLQPHHPRLPIIKPHAARSQSARQRTDLPVLARSRLSYRLHDGRPERRQCARLPPDGRPRSAVSVRVVGQNHARGRKRRARLVVGTSLIGRQMSALNGATVQAAIYLNKRRRIVGSRARAGSEIVILRSFGALANRRPA